MLKNYKYYLNKLDCANWAKRIEDAIKSNKDYEDVKVNFNN